MPLLGWLAATLLAGGVALYAFRRGVLEECPANSSRWAMLLSISAGATGSLTALTLSALGRSVHPAWLYAPVVVGFGLAAWLVLWACLTHTRDEIRGLFRGANHCGLLRFGAPDRGRPKTRAPYPGALI